MRGRVLLMVSAGVLLGVPAGLAQAKGRPVETKQAAAATRYFELTLVLRVPASAGREARVQSLSTDVAVVPGRPSLSGGKARVISQVPVTLQTGPKYLDIGTKLDCNDVRMEGGAVAMAVVLETSQVDGTVMTEGKDGRRLEEPLIRQRTLQLQVKLPIARPTVIFDDKNMEAGRLQPIGEAAGDGGTKAMEPAVAVGPEMQVEMTVRELP